MRFRIWRDFIAAIVEAVVDPKERREIRAREELKRKLRSGEG